MNAALTHVLNIGMQVHVCEFMDFGYFFFHKKVAKSMSQPGVASVNIIYFLGVAKIGLCQYSAGVSINVLG